jgi:DNA processing protein
MDELFVRAAFARAPGLRSPHVAALLAAAEGNLTRCLEPQTLARVDLPPSALSWLRFPDTIALDSDLQWIAGSGAHVLASTDPDYPRSLRELADAPAVLFVLGDPGKLAAPQLAMVGSRSATPLGSDTAFRFAAQLARAGVTITSGLAMGIDAASHRGALSVAAAAAAAEQSASTAAAPSTGTTVAVFATGLDQVYPIQHNELAQRVRDFGALVSELPPRTPPRKANFPQRNRLISGLSMATLVVEARSHSGSLITAHHARRQERKVLALPGSIASPMSCGCHDLIRAGATLVRNCADVLQELKIPPPNEGLVRRGDPRQRRPALDKGYEMLLDAVGFGPVGVDILAVRTGLPGELISSMLLVLQLEGRVAPYPGGQFGRIPE